MGYSWSVRCFLGYELWDRELNTYYRLLENELSVEQRGLLRFSHLSWIDTRDKTISMNSRLPDQEYDQIETRYVLMRAGDVSRTISPIIKQRVSSYGSGISIYFTINTF